MKRQLIAEAWDSYARKVLPKDAGRSLRIEMRRAFYAGAWGFFTSTLAVLDHSKEPTAADQKRLADTVDEMEKFNTDVQKGLA